MKPAFRRQFAAYADYHRDRWNRLTHEIGTPILVLAALLPFSLISVPVFDLRIPLASLLVVPALIFWMGLDLAIGAIIAGAAIPLVIIAAIIVGQVSAVWVGTIALALFFVGWALQIAGHAFFEHRAPALLDNPLHMLVSPMFIAARLLVSLGLRRDLADVLQR
jgi:uncharacterized membrane protein YGL010W